MNMQEREEGKEGSKKGFGLIEKLILDGEAPQHIKIAAAKGALPLAPLSLLRLKVFLKDDEDTFVRSEAMRSIDAIPDEEALAMLREKKCHTSVLACFAEKKKEDSRFLDAIVQNPSASDETIAAIAENAPGESLGMLLMNEQRLIESPLILEALERNPSLNALQKAKLGELRDKFPTGRVPREANLSIAEAEMIEEEPLLEIDVDAMIGTSYIIDGDEFDKGPQDVVNAYRRILTMGVPEKIVKALRGGMIERQILIRDSHRIISLSVLANPRITEQEIENISSSKNVDDEILKEIGRNRDWTKHYSISLNLVRNPKTPPSISTSLLHKLNNTDLKHLQNDKNVPELIRSMAKKVFTTRTQKSGIIKKK